MILTIEIPNTIFVSKGSWSSKCIICEIKSNSFPKLQIIIPHCLTSHENNHCLVLINKPPNNFALVCQTGENLILCIVRPIKLLNNI